MLLITFCFPLLIKDLMPKVFLKRHLTLKEGIKKGNNIKI
jgi:hypothetical protein